MAKQSAGLLLFRRKRRDGAGARPIEVLLGHPGGPYWAGKDTGAWSIPKGEFLQDEEPLAAARREFAEEMGAAPEGEFIPLAPVKQPGGKVVHIWALEADFNIAFHTSNLFSMEWPPRSGHQQEFPEVDRAGWFPLEVARQKIIRGQAPFLDQLVERVGVT